MASPCFTGMMCHLPLLFLVLLQLCTTYALEDSNHYKTVEKRIFCNYFGCRNMNGKREYPKNNKRYNMFNRPSASKRTISSDGYYYDSPSNFNYYTDEPWPSKDFLTTSKEHLQSPVLSKFTNNGIQGEDDLSADIFEKDTFNLHPVFTSLNDISWLSHYEKYKILKKALQIMHEIKSEKNNAKLHSSEEENLNKWLTERRK